MALVNALIPAVRIRVKPTLSTFGIIVPLLLTTFNCDW